MVVSHNENFLRGINKNCIVKTIQILKQFVSIKMLRKKKYIEIFCVKLIFEFQYFFNIFFDRKILLIFFKRYFEEPTMTKQHFLTFYDIKKYN